MGLQNSNRIQRRHKGYIAPDGGQAHPIAGFYAEMRKKITPRTQTNTVPESSLEEARALAQKEEILAKQRLVFGSKPGVRERRKAIDAASHNIAGIIVPPKPSEPDNCCMSGCVNCVWDMYRDEMEEWAEKSTKARVAMQARRKNGEEVAEKGAPNLVAVSMDDDGGGSETNWGEETRDLFEDVPVGIREFMKTEKKLKQRHKAAQATTV
ncbi:hypothetical protein P153DRAFT_282060 [Dothidotthia symphoricarpi CBS 119687]|uniref:Oxidoreductase-like domain-containing protein n=1 Tax=Dothidotthia symphoricarpi CBS 119687 TaxID=1392245 RepID=A0A6A6AQ99_9PLEO|nr:uncharacterized protein P153DRAFT_282060 [Dothidotthia symphoricarpi CBS 119687]KAF2133373.1 hypothetical protein P153DRAFT_282060 [Dothidotthia symphoricarpi CBS 119687]